MPANTNLSTAQLLETYWVRFKQTYATRYPEAPALTKKAFSSWLPADSHAFARWTNHDAHQKGQHNWRVPLSRIFDVAALLECAQPEVDELMATRLREAQLAHERTDGLHVAQWLQPHLQELSSRPELDPQEELVLKAFREARAASVPGAQHGRVSENGIAALGSLMCKWWSEQATAMNLSEAPPPQDSCVTEQKARFLSAARRNLEERRAPNTPAARHKQLHHLRKVLSSKLT